MAHIVANTRQGSSSKQIRGAILLDENDDQIGIASNPLPVDNNTGIADNPEFFEDTSFVTGDSPVTLDLNTALGRNATQVVVINDGAGNFTVAFSTEGAAFGDAITMKKDESLEFSGVSVDSLKITWIADSAYRVICI